MAVARELLQSGASVDLPRQVSGKEHEIVVRVLHIFVCRKKFKNKTFDDWIHIQPEVWHKSTTINVCIIKTAGKLNVFYHYHSKFVLNLKIFLGWWYSVIQSMS